MDNKVLFLALTSFALQKFKLVGGAIRCDGQLQVNLQGVIWKTVTMDRFDLGWANKVCLEVDCGSALSVRKTSGPRRESLTIQHDCEESALIDCLGADTSPSYLRLYVNCSVFVRLVHGPRLCSGSLQIHWNRSWNTVCEVDFDQQDALVVCRELGCGAPSLLQGGLSGDGLAPLGKPFHCEGNESALMNCPRSRSIQACSTEAAVNLTCSERGMRLVGGASGCAGTVELERGGQWKPLSDVTSLWDLTVAEVVCAQLNCGSAVTVYKQDLRTKIEMWTIRHRCVKQTAALSGSDYFSYSFVLNVICSDLLTRPNISLSGVSSEAQVQGLRVLLGSNFSVGCSIEPQYPGSFFQLISPTGDLTIPAVNPSSHFLFSDTGPAHEGGYTCVYHHHKFNHNFSSRSHTLQLTLGASYSDLAIRLVILLILNLIYISAFCYWYWKATMGQQPQQ